MLWVKVVKLKISLGQHILCQRQSAGNEPTVFWAAVEGQSFGLQIIAEITAKLVLLLNVNWEQI